MQIQRKSQQSFGLVASHQVEHFNNVNAVTGIDLDAEQEKLFFRAEGNKVSTSRQNNVHQKEEMFPSRTFLRAKLENIISRCGLKTVGKDVEHCLLLGLRELMYRLIRNMIRMSKQRVDYEKKRHRTLVTSDIHRHIMIMSRDQKRLQVEKSNKDISDGEIDKSAKSSAATKRTGANLMLETAARTNKAVRVSLGGDDFISKWKLLSKNARHQENRGIGDHHNEKMIEFSQGCQGKRTEDRIYQDRFMMVPKRVVSMKDVIATLEREPQMSKSSFMHHLYERSAVAATKDENMQETDA